MSLEGQNTSTGAKSTTAKPVVGMSQVVDLGEIGALVTSPSHIIKMFFFGEF